MKTNRHSTHRIDELFARLARRPLDVDETRELQALLHESPEALDRYLDHCEMEVWLAAAGESLVSPVSISAMDHRPGAGEPSPPPSNRPFPVLVASAAVAAGLGLAAVLLVSTRDEKSGEGLAVVSGDSPEQVGNSFEPKPQPVAPGNSEGERERDPWKVINATGALNHPGLKDKPVTLVSANEPLQFNRDIRPILSETCFHCHGPDEEGRRADLRLDILEGAVADLGGYQAIVPGDPDASEAWWRIISEDPDELMPPPESHLVLTTEQKQILKRWIEEGAVFEGHWAYEPARRPELPDGIADWGRNEIDLFVSRQLAREGMSPSSEASPRTLIRRLTLDLTGLPPTRTEIHAFLEDYADRGEQAWQDAITRLLDSPHFAERMAVPWLDQSRYADTNGYSIDGGRSAWLWRDWVIRAYRDNLPFDRFVTEQIAGDLLPGATHDQVVATGFNRNHMITHEGGTIPEENLTNYTADRVKTASEVFLGLTMACAQCHDHKYDPISMRDYYRFFAFFNELDDKGLDGNAGVNARPSIQAKTVLSSPKELTELREELQEVQSQLASAGGAGFEKWVNRARNEVLTRGEGFAFKTLETRDVSSPNRPGPFEVQSDGSIVLSKPGKGLNAFSHVLEIPRETGSLHGLRVRFFPHGEDEKLTPFPDGVPKVTTVLVSADNQPAAQVDIYKQVALARATASSHEGAHDPSGILDERNLHWWQPGSADSNPHLTITFESPIDPEVAPFLSVMVFYGKNASLPYRWRIDGFVGEDTDSVFDPATASALSKNSADWSEDERQLVLAAYRSLGPDLEPLRVRIANLEDRIRVLNEEHSALVMNASKKPRDTHVLDRGQYDVPLEKVEPGTPEVLPPLSLASGDRATRLDLAKWMTEPDHPLTARVAVNRIWSVFFGRGIVSTTADFGSQGAWPSHPELLDWLAVDFVEGGWDQKALIRKIVSSAAYRQDSSATAEQLERDPDNRLLGRGPRFRLAAEFIRDQALSLSGLLVPRIGGPSVQPYQPPGLWKEVSHFGSTPATKQVFVQDRGEKLYRRSLYTIVKRTSPHPSMAAFDAPNREMCITERGVTNTPLQALVTLNDPQFAEAARVFAGRLLSEHGDLTERERLNVAFEKVTGRLPGTSELAAIDGFLSEERKRLQGDAAAAKAMIRVGESPIAGGLDPIDHAVWTQVSSLLFNLSETLTRS